MVNRKSTKPPAPPAEKVAITSAPPHKCFCCGDKLKKNKSHPIFDDYGKFRHIQFLLIECVQKTIVEVPGSVQSICVDCLVQLEQNYAFKLKCAKNLREMQPDGDDDDGDGDSDAAEDENKTSGDENEPEDVDVSGQSVEKPDDEQGENMEDDIDEQLDDNQEPQYELVTHIVVHNVDGSIKDEHRDVIDYQESEQQHDENAELVIEMEAASTIDEQLNGTENPACEELPVVDGNIEQTDQTELMSVDKSTPEPEIQEFIIYGSDCGKLDTANTIIAEYVVEEANLDSNPLLTSFVDALNVHSIKEKIRTGIPVHSIASGDRYEDSSNGGGDAAIGGEDDFGNIIDIDDYVMSIVSVAFCEFTPFKSEVDCALCSPSVGIVDYVHLMKHIWAVHTVNAESFACCLPTCDFKCNDAGDLHNHMFVQHGENIGAVCFLTCQSCDLVTESLVRFGKHTCHTTDPSADPTVTTVTRTGNDNNDDPYTCAHCQRPQRSQRRHHFHQQFHRSTPRPKICLICDQLFANEPRFYEHVQFAHEQFAQHFCTFCDRSFVAAAELRRHEYTHTAERAHVCPTCDKSFCDAYALTNHRHIHDNSYECAHCGKSYNRKFRLRKHMLAAHVQHNAAVLPVCERCARVFDTNAAANAHWRAEHADDESTSAADVIANAVVEHAFCCEFCEAAFDQVPQLLEHKAAHERRFAEGNTRDQTTDGEVLKYQCGWCPRRFTRYCRLRSHANAHPESKRAFPVKRSYVCELNDCRKPYADWNNFQSHRKTVHLENPSIIHCRQCEAVFFKSWQYAYHKKSAHEEKKQCPLCAVSFVLQRALDEHMVRMHVAGGEEKKWRAAAVRKEGAMVKVPMRKKPMVLDENGVPIAKKLKMSGVAKVEENVHFCAQQEGDKQTFRCLECGKVSARRSNAMAHVQMVHMKVRNFQCSQCDRTFYHRGDLNDHLLMHSDVKPFQCPICPYKVRTNSMLQSHIRAHRNERPFQCPKCPKAFKRQMVLKNHLKLHTGVKSFDCNMCEMSFFTKYSLAGHKLKKHQTVDGKNDVESSNVETPNAEDLPSDRRLSDHAESELDDGEIALGDCSDREDDPPPTADRNTNADDARAALDGSVTMASNVADRMRVDDVDGEEIALGDCQLDIGDTDDLPNADDAPNMDVDNVAIAVTEPAQLVKDPLRLVRGSKSAKPKTIFVMPGPPRRGERNAKGRKHGPHEAIDVITG